MSVKTKIEKSAKESVTLFIILRPRNVGGSFREMFYESNFNNFSSSFRQVENALLKELNTLRVPSTDLYFQRGTYPKGFYIKFT